MAQSFPVAGRKIYIGGLFVPPTTGRLLTVDTARQSLPRPGSLSANGRPPARSVAIRLPSPRRTCQKRSADELETLSRMMGRIESNQNSLHRTLEAMRGHEEISVQILAQIREHVKALHPARGT